MSTNPPKIQIQGSDAINYSFLTRCYLAGTIICALLICLDRFWNMKSVEGFWVIFAPCLAGLVWASLKNKKASLVPCTDDKTD
ncbi:unnamed protein product [Heterosigma akashiwo]